MDKYCFKAYYKSMQQLILIRKRISKLMTPKALNREKYLHYDKSRNKAITYLC